MNYLWGAMEITLGSYRGVAQEDSLALLYYGLHYVRGGAFGPDLFFC